jgi:hypothetical protein
MLINKKLPGNFALKTLLLNEGPRAQRGGSRQEWTINDLERAKGFEPSTPTLARLCSTPELRPLAGRFINAKVWALLLQSASSIGTQWLGGWQENFFK